MVHLNHFPNCHVLGFSANFLNIEKTRQKKVSHLETLIIYSEVPREGLLNFIKIIGCLFEIAGSRELRNKTLGFNIH